MTRHWHSHVASPTHVPIVEPEHRSEHSAAQSASLVQLYGIPGHSPPADDALELALLDDEELEDELVELVTHGAPQVSAASLTHVASQAIEQQKASFAQTVLTHELHDVARAVPCAQTSWAHAPPELEVLEALTLLAATVELGVPPPKPLKPPVPGFPPPAPVKMPVL